MKEVCFLTHTSTQIQDGVPIEDWPLSEKGRLQAQEIAIKMTHKGITKVVSSDEQKAIQTAEIIAKELGLGSSQIPGIQEVHREISKIVPFEEFMKICINYLDGEIPLGWEDRIVAQTRLMEALRKVVVSSIEGDTILVVGHGISGILIESAIKKQSIKSAGNIEQLQNGSGKYLNILVDAVVGLSVVGDWQ